MSKKGISAVSLLAVMAAILLARQGWTEETSASKSAAALLQDGTVQMGEAVSALGKDDLEGASVSSGKAFDLMLKAPAGGSAVAGKEGFLAASGLKPVGEGASAGVGAFVPAPTAQDPEAQSSIGRYLKGAAVGASIGFPIGAIPAAYIGYLVAGQAQDFYRVLAEKFFGIALKGGTTGLIGGAVIGGVVGGIIGAGGGAAMGAAILGYSPLRNAIVKMGEFFKRIASSGK